jgi:hypothetical protein
MSIKCSACNTPITNKYCSSCGQQFTYKKATTLSLVLDFFSNIFSVKKSFIGTSKKLLSNPKFIVENFHQGNKRFYQSPGSFLIYGITLIAIHTLIFGPELWGVKFDFSGLGMQYAVWIILLPFMTLCSYLTFIRQGFHAAKHIISISYISTVFLFIFLILDDLINVTTGGFKSDFFMALFFIFTFIWNSLVFSTKKKIGYHILNTIVQLLIFSGLFFLLVLLFQTDNKTS